MGRIVTPAASMGGFGPGAAYGSVAERLLANGMDPQALRTNTLLRDREWKEMDQTVMDIALQRLIGVSDLMNAGLKLDLGGKGLAKTVLQYEDMSDMSAASMSMDGESEGSMDRVNFDIKSMPLPLTHKEFKLNLRVLQESRNAGQPLDVTQSAIAARKVATSNEEVLFNGASAYTFGGGTIRGYTDHPNRNTVSLVENWDDSGTTGEDILDDVLAMKQASIDAKHYGPWMLYLPTNYDAEMDNDFKSNSDKSIRARLKEVAGIIDVKVADVLADDNVVLVEFAPETVRMVVGLLPTTVEWDVKGGLVTHWKVMDIMVPQIRADQDGNSGITHLS